MANLAIYVVLALCAETSMTPDTKELSADLISVRKLVLEAVSRSIKEVSQLDVADVRYGRLLALADLCNRLLTVRFTPSARKQPQDEFPTHIAKVMLDKNFVATLTVALSEVDLDYPNIKSVVVSILKPLEYLSKVAIKMSRSSSKGKAVPGKTESVPSESSDEEDVEEADREETPDLYRNSALGMFGGEMEDVHFTAENEMDEDEEDEDEDVDMDFGDETGSEDTSNTEEGDEDDMNNETHQPTEGWQDGDEDEEDEEDDGLVENEENDDVVDDEGGDAEEGDEMLWQDIQEDVDVPDGSGDDIDEDEDVEVQHIPILRTDGGNDPEAPSDEEDLVNELGILNPEEIEAGGEDIFQSLAGFAGVGRLPISNGFADGNPRETTGFYIPRRHRGFTDDNVTFFGQARSGATPPDATTHPLLLAGPQISNRLPSGHSRSSRRSPPEIITNNTNELLQTIEDLIGGGAVQLFHHIMTRGRGGPPSETIRLDVPPPTFLNVERSLGQRRPPNVLSASLRVERAPRSGEHRGQTRDFEPLFTFQRWTEEAKILHNDFVSERTQTLSNHLILALLPAAVEAAKQAKEKAEQEQIKQREAEAKAAAEAAANAQSQEGKQASGEDKEIAQSEGGRMETEQTDVTSSTQPAIDFQSSDQQDDNQGPVSDVTAQDGDTEMVEASTDLPVTSSTDPIETPQQSTGEGPATSSSGQGESSQAPRRITIMIHGNPVDITDTGMDPTFLEALPDDMREEVVNQHIRASRVERPPDSQISSDFLDALPPEIRAELIQQERQEQARRRGPETAPGGEPNHSGVAADIDPASFIASLDPQLREVVLLDSDDGFIQSLPSHMIAEAGVYREGSRPRRGTQVIHTNIHRPPMPRKFPPPHDSIQLLDKTGIATLVRLLFFPQIYLKKTLLFKVLVNLCENTKTRTELFSLLLNILQDGTGDVAAVDKSFSQMSFRNSKASIQQTPRAAGKQRAGSDYFSGLSMPNSHYEVTPELVAQRCLEGLTFIVSANELSSLFFLTEHELPVGLRRASSKKGKGKEKQSSQTYYPIVLLLGLLDRQTLLKTPSTMEFVVGLLATVTRPLTSIKDTNKESQGTSTSASGEPSSTSALPTPVLPPASISPSAAPSEEPSQPTMGTSVVEQPPPSEPPNQARSGPSAEHSGDKSLLSKPPQIPHTVLRLIVNILTTGDCSGRTFQQSLALIQHLSYIPDARDVIATELKSKAQEFGQSLHADLDQLATALQDSTGSDVLVSSVASKFSLASSEQAKLLRVLKTIDYMYSAKVVPPSDNAPGNGDAEKVQGIYESFQFTPLWCRLGDCLAVVEEKPDTEHIATVLLPLIEALMVVCKYVGPKSHHSSMARALRGSASPRSPSTAQESMEDLFVSFTDAHRKILNLMVRNNPSLMSGSFSLLVHNPRVLDFDNKRNYFSQQLHRRPHVREHHGTLQLNVRRARVFEDSFQYLQRKTGDQIKYGKLSVRFYDEEGVDAGGVTREWFQILARQMFDPNYALFQPCAADRLTYQPNKNSWVNPEHLSFFKFVGRVIGKAIYDGRLLDAYFARSLYRQLLGKPVDYRDVEWVDPEYYNSLCWILENDPTPLDLNFSVEADEFGVNRIISLKEGGDSVPVTQENKREFVQLSAQYRLYSSIKEQIESLLGGFYEIIPKELVTIFNEQELELLISGTPDIDVDEWRAATEYNGYSGSDPVIVWWWRALKSFTRDERAKVLSFATGTSRVPLGGFVDLQGVQGVQRFSIHRAYGDADRLPQAHTCFNQIDLPQYSSYEMLRQQLLLATNEGAEGFGFA